MLDREVIKEFLSEELDEFEIPSNVSFDELTETFCKFVEDDYYEWLKDNFKTFFNHNNPDWKWITKMINRYQK